MVRNGVSGLSGGCDKTGVFKNGEEKVGSPQQVQKVQELLQRSTKDLGKRQKVSQERIQTIQACRILRKTNHEADRQVQEGGWYEAS